MEKTKSLNIDLSSEDMFLLGEEIKATATGRIRWGDTLFLNLNDDAEKCMVVWTPKRTSEKENLPGFYSDDGSFFFKIKPKPGGWVTWADLKKVSEKHNQENEPPEFPDPDPDPDPSKKVIDEIQEGVSELERNRRQIVDFADGLVSDITVSHKGKALKLEELFLQEEAFKAQIQFPKGFKSGAYLLVGKKAQLLIPERTISYGVHLNEEQLLERLERLEALGALENLNSEVRAVESVVVVYRSHLRCYPDLHDLNSFLFLAEKLTKNQKFPKQLQLLLAIAGYIPNRPERATLKLFDVACCRETFEPKLLESKMESCEKKIKSLFEEVDSYVSQLSEKYKQNHDKSIPPIPHTPMLSSISNLFLRQCESIFADNFSEPRAERMMSSLYELKEKAYKSAEAGIVEVMERSHLNELISYISAMIYDAVVEEILIESDLIKPIEVVIFEAGEITDPNSMNSIWLPKICSWDLKAISQKQKDSRLHTFLDQIKDLENMAYRSGYSFKEAISPLEQALTSRGERPVAATTNKPNKPLVDDFTLKRVIERLELNKDKIRDCIKVAPTDHKIRNRYYQLLSLILSIGKAREIVWAKLDAPEKQGSETYVVRSSLCEDIGDLKQLIGMIQLDFFAMAGDDKPRRNRRNLLYDRMAQNVAALTGRTIDEIFGSDRLIQIHADTILEAVAAALRTTISTLEKALEKALEEVVGAQQAAPLHSPVNGLPLIGRKKSKSRRVVGAHHAAPFNIEQLDQADIQTVIEQLPGSINRLKELLEKLDFGEDHISLISMTSRLLSTLQRLAHEAEGAEGKLVKLPSEYIFGLQSQTLRGRFHHISQAEINEAIKSGLAGSELVDYLSLRDNAICQEEFRKAEKLKARREAATIWEQQLIPLDNYPNLHSFLNGLSLKPTTTGRKIIELKRISENILNEAAILLHEAVILQKCNYSKAILTNFMAHSIKILQEWTSRGGFQTRPYINDLLTVARKKALIEAICYIDGVDGIDELLEVEAQYDQLLKQKFDTNSQLSKEYELAESQFKELLKTLGYF